ncbi:hypothetical protein CR513_34037, partial [Mucuna pruriens]
MESSWIVRKKRSVRVSISTTTNKHKTMDNMFNMLPIDLHINIMKRLRDNELSIAMCVSKTWRNLILYSCIRSRSSLTLRYLSLFDRMIKEESDKITPTWLSNLVDNIIPYPFSGINHLLKWCSKMMHCKVKSKHLIGSCNGLLLFCHKEGQVGNLTYGSYHYYVINPITKQNVAVLKPGPCSAPYSYAALVYEPSESWFFKIVRFQGFRHVNVFSSESGCWTNLSLQLPEKENEASWGKKWVYSKGAIYWLSTSRHMIKLHVDPQESMEKQAVAIKLPLVLCDSDDYQMDISLEGGEVVFVAFVGEYLRILELKEDFDGIGGCSFKWILIHNVYNGVLEEINRHGSIQESFSGFLFRRIAGTVNFLSELKMQNVELLSYIMMVNDLVYIPYVLAGRRQNYCRFLFYNGEALSIESVLRAH